MPEMANPVKAGGAKLWVYDKRLEGFIRIAKLPIKE
jgi:hypothetical protein